jgi:hypothetical protein
MRSGRFHFVSYRVAEFFMRGETTENSQHKKAPNAWVYGLVLIIFIAYVSLLAPSYYGIASVYRLL